MFLSKTWFFWKSILNIHFCINFHNFQQTKATPKEFIICNVARILKSINLYARIWIPATHEKYKFFLHSFDHLVNGIPGVYKEIIISLIISVIRKFLLWKTVFSNFNNVWYSFHESRIIFTTKAKKIWALNGANEQWTMFEMNLGKLCMLSLSQEEFEFSFSQYFRRNVSIEFKMKQLFLKESERNKKNMTHTHYAWEQFQKLDFITFYLNETFVFFFNRKKKNWN